MYWQMGLALTAMTFLNASCGSAKHANTRAFLGSGGDAAAANLQVAPTAASKSGDALAAGSEQPIAPDTAGPAHASFAVDNKAATAPGGCPTSLGLSDREQCAAIAAMLLPDTLPASPGNAYADSLAAAKLGFQVFFDPRFSLDGQMRCATCHLPEKTFHDGKAVSMGRGGLDLPRNSPSLLTAAWYTGSFFWDGRADSLWSQPLFAFENANEMATTRLDIAHTLATQPFYRQLYEATFGPMPDLTDLARFPTSGRPGDAAFDAMSPADQDTINVIVANLGKALEAYMRKLATGRSRLDAYLLGNADAFDASERKGLLTFVEVGCASCHSGPTLSDGRFYNLQVPAHAGAASDRGRAAGLATLAANPFNHLGRYYDPSPVQGAPAPAIPQPTAADEGAFRTPSLRDVAATAPYGHNGYYLTLRDVLQNHGSTPLTSAQMDSIQIFLLSLNGVYPERPWNNWPSN